MSDDDQKYGRKDPPSNDDEWHFIWSGAHKAHKSWPVNKILISLMQSWKIWLVMMALALVVGGDDVLVKIIGLFS